MTSVRRVVNTALRQIGRLGAGREARTADATDTLAALQGLYGSWIAAGAFGRLRDVVPTGTDYTAQGSERIYRQSEETLSVSLPELVSDVGIQDYGHERRGYYGTVITITTDGSETIVDVKPSQPIGYATTPCDGSVVVISDATTGIAAAWVYEGHTKRWQSLDNLQMDNEAPLSSADPEGLSASLAMEIADQFGADVAATTQRKAARYAAALTQRFGMRSEASQGVYY